MQSIVDEGSTFLFTILTQGPPPSTSINLIVFPQSFHIVIESEDEEPSQRSFDYRSIPIQTTLGTIGIK